MPSASSPLLSISGSSSEALVYSSLGRTIWGLELRAVRSLRLQVLLGLKTCARVGTICTLRPLTCLSHLSVPGHRHWIMKAFLAMRETSVHPALRGHVGQSFRVLHVKQSLNFRLRWFSFPFEARSLVLLDPCPYLGALACIRTASSLWNPWSTKATRFDPHISDSTMFICQWRRF